MYIDTEQQVYDLVYDILKDKYIDPIKFKYDYLKICFFQTIKKYIPSIYIINCDSSKNRLQIELQNIPVGSFVVFNHVNKCEFTDILYSKKIDKKIYVK